MQVNHVYIHVSSDLRYFVHSPDEVIKVDFKGRQSAKHIIESLGIPHTEVSNIMVNNQPQALSYILENNDHIEIFPWSPGDDLLNEFPLDLRFILDNHLGKLATYLRILGIDALYQNDFQDADIIKIINDDQRILLSRDRQLLMRRNVRWGYCIREDNPKDQLIELVNRFNLWDKIKPLNRCLKCNHRLNPIDKMAIIHRLEPLTKLYYEEFFLCPECNQIYWKGSHYQHMMKFIQEIGEN